MKPLFTQNIFLTGFMGSGKSHWGHIWAQRYGYSFHDLDADIEKSFGMPVEQIFEKHSESKFRELERYHLRKFENKKKVLVACGGGTPCFFDNLEWMKQNGTVIYLKASPEYILSRVMDETDKRPLLKEVNTSELLFFIQKKLKEREPVYVKADHILEVEKLSNDSLHFLEEKLFQTPGVDNKGSVLKKTATRKKNNHPENGKDVSNDNVEKKEKIQTKISLKPHHHA